MHLIDIFSKQDKRILTPPGTVVVHQSLVVDDKNNNKQNNIHNTHPGAIVVCQSLVVNDKRGEEAEEEGAQQFATHHLQQIFKTLYMKKKN